MNERLMNVLIVDDEAPARSRMRSLLDDLQKEMWTAVVGEAGNGREALLKIEELQPDIVLLDVHMPGMNGIEVARHAAMIKPLNGKLSPQCVFTTAFDDYAVQAFEVHAVDYLVKPVRATRLFDALARAKARIDEREAAQQVADPAVALAAVTKAAAIAGLSRRHISVSERGKLILVPVVDVLYFKAEMKYTTIRTRDHEYLTEEPLSSLEVEFQELFLRIHRNALVARDAIAGYTRASGEVGEASDNSWQILLRGVPETLPVSRRQWPMVKALLRV